MLTNLLNKNCNNSLFDEEESLFFESFSEIQKKNTPSLSKEYPNVTFYGD